MSKVAPLFSSPFSASPIARTGSSPVSPYSMPPLGGGNCTEPLTFKKVPCAQLTYGSSDNDVASECGRVSRSPSLLTSLFTSQGKSASSSRSGSASGSTSASGSSQGTPVTPMSPGDGCRPILRQGTPLIISPEDGLGVAPVTDEPEAGFTSPSSGGGLYERRATLKFAPCSRPAGLSVTAAAYSKCKTGKIARSPAPIATWQDLPCALPMESEDMSDDDDGYVEDEEDGLDSDFEAFTFSSHTSGSKWHSRFPGFSAFDKRSNSVHPADVDVESEMEAELDVFPPEEPIAFQRSAPPSRKTSISIKGNCVNKERCSKHLSPPPSDLFSSSAVSPLELGISVAPPPLLSPSAANFCRKKDGGKPAQAPVGDYITLGYAHSRGWRSDDGWKLAALSTAATHQPRKMSLPEGKPFSILRCTTLATGCPDQGVTVARRASVQATI